MSPEHLEIVPKAKHFRSGSAQDAHRSLPPTRSSAFTLHYRGTEVLLVLSHPARSSWFNFPIVEMGPTDLGYVFSHAKTSCVSFWSPTDRCTACARVGLMDKINGRTFKV